MIEAGWQDNYSWILIIAITSRRQTGHPVSAHRQLLAQVSQATKCTLDVYDTHEYHETKIGNLRRVNQHVETHESFSPPYKYNKAHSSLSRHFPSFVLMLVVPRWKNILSKPQSETDLKIVVIKIVLVIIVFQWWNIRPFFLEFFWDNFSWQYMQLIILFKVSLEFFHMFKNIRSMKILPSIEFILWCRLRFIFSHLDWDISVPCLLLGDSEYECHESLLINIE